MTNKEIDVFIIQSLRAGMPREQVVAELREKSGKGHKFTRFDAWVRQFPDYERAAKNATLNNLFLAFLSLLLLVDLLGFIGGLLALPKHIGLWLIFQPLFLFVGISQIPEVKKFKFSGYSLSRSLSAMLVLSCFDSGIYGALLFLFIAGFVFFSFILTKRLFPDLNWRGIPITATA